MAEPKRTVHPLVKTWVILHGLVTLMYCIPFAPPAYKPLVDGKPIDPNITRPTIIDWVNITNDKIIHSPSSPLYWYIIWPGYWQFWDMFSPNPSPRDYHLDFVVTYEDGTNETIAWPRMAKMSIVEKFFNERYRKFSERIRSPQENFLWAPVLNKVAADAYRRNGGKMPKRMMMREIYYDLPPYGQPITWEYKTHVVCDLLIDANEVKKVHGL